jgi:hypothetical protein
MKMAINHKAGINNLSQFISDNVPRTRDPMLTDAQLERLKTVSSVALGVIAMAGTVALAAVAPNVFGALDKLFFRNNSRLTHKQKERKLARTFYYLKRSGYIDIKAEGAGFVIKLTSLGRKRVEKFDMETLSIAKPKVWNKTWWVTAADIPTRDYKKAADMLRWKLKQLGFYPLQRTLWFYPYNPTKELNFIVDHYGIGEFVTVMEAKRLDADDEEKLKRHFKKLRIL